MMQAKKIQQTEKAKFINKILALGWPEFVEEITKVTDISLLHRIRTAEMSRDNRKSYMHRIHQRVRKLASDNAEQEMKNESRRGRL